MSIPAVLLCVALASVCWVSCNGAEGAMRDGRALATDRPVRAALLVTLAGDHKLSDYFEWSCKTIGASSELFDMLVFHESNKRVAELQCAPNVKMIDIGPSGLSKLIIGHIFQGFKGEQQVKDRMTEMLRDVLLHGPRYLVEYKPMLGSLLAQHLGEYSHWSYTDPDIIWGNLSDWVEVADLQRFSYITYAKNMDAGRLFLRGQLTLHKNEAHVNNLWRNLGYLNVALVAGRIGTAHRMVEQKKSSDEIFSKNFYSCEGWYSQLVFQTNSSVKIIGRGFDDFFRHPVVLHTGRLSRCSLGGDLTQCIAGITGANTTVPTVYSLPPPALIPAQALFNPIECKMFWLPSEVRYCIAGPVYDKEKALQQPTARESVRLKRVGEAVYEGGQWSVNNEQSARRQLLETAAFFHFRHWDDFLSTSISTTWTGEAGPIKTIRGIGGTGAGEAGSKTTSADCMVLYLRFDAALSFEACDVVAAKEKLAPGSLMLEQPPKAINGAGAGGRGRGKGGGRSRGRQRDPKGVQAKGQGAQEQGDAPRDALDQMLQHQRKELEVGPNRAHSRDGREGAGGGLLGRGQGNQDRGHREAPNAHDHVSKNLSQEEMDKRKQHVISQKRKGKGKGRRGAD